MFTVYVESHAHYREEGGRSEVGKYKTYERALRKAKRIVDKSLRACAKRNMTAEELFESYMMWGDDPFILPSAEPDFSARDYAKERAGNYVGLRAWLPW